MAQFSVSSNAVVLRQSACSKVAPLVPPDQQLVGTQGEGGMRSAQWGEECGEDDEEEVSLHRFSSRSAGFTPDLNFPKPNGVGRYAPT